MLIYSKDRIKKNNFCLKSRKKKHNSHQKIKRKMQFSNSGILFFFFFPNCYTAYYLYVSHLNLWLVIEIKTAVCILILNSASLNYSKMINSDFIDNKYMCNIDFFRKNNYDVQFWDERLKVKLFDLEIKKKKKCIWFIIWKPIKTFQRHKKVSIWQLGNKL